MIIEIEDNYYASEVRFTIESLPKFDIFKIHFKKEGDCDRYKDNEEIACLRLTRDEIISFSEALKTVLANK